MAAQIPTLTTCAADSVEPPWLSRCAYPRLVPGSSTSLAPDSRSRTAVMWPQLLWLRTKQMLRWRTTLTLKSLSSLMICHLHRLKSCFFIFFITKLYKSTLCSALDGSFDRLTSFLFRSRRPCPPTSAFVVLIIYCFSTVSIHAVPKEACKPSTPQKPISC